ncbi:hypothetical protein KFL_004140050 [Klebsormidium nitens]|uniref:SnoaL-like domain-containing protein n=1 Tax=Klebsormidium nitens TaxID=105231 RepID=A0A0U9HKK1_KLENI|nr:hypothetical protein KFL_004140050 [Klebsormidium nitens]|eukprot:GAQ88269.1 hypothetical protein KFL_004140050 [Klebsormidium nitens]
MGHRLLYIFLVAIVLATAIPARAVEGRVDGRLCPFELGFAPCNNASRLVCCLGSCGSQNCFEVDQPDAMKAKSLRNTGVTIFNLIKAFSQGDWEAVTSLMAEGATSSGPGFEGGLSAKSPRALQLQQAAFTYQPGQDLSSSFQVLQYDLLGGSPLKSRVVARHHTKAFQFEVDGTFELTDVEPGKRKWLIREAHLKNFRPSGF